jgi:hypothetical protein
MTMTEPRQCEHRRADGGRCRGRALEGLTYCAFHDPQNAGRQREGRRRGGRAVHRKPAALPADAPDLALATPGEVREALALLTNRVVKGRLDAKLANAACYLLSTLLRSVQVDEFDRRLQALEAAQQNGRVG